MLPPGVTGSGESSFVTDMSADGAPTVVVATALSLPGFGSVVAEVTVAVLLITVASKVDAMTLTTSVNTALPMVMLGVLHEIAPVPPTEGVVHDQPAGDASETNVVLDGTLSLSDAEVALLGPALLTVMV